MQCFVAGGTGVIGRRAVPALISAGHDVTVISRSSERDRRFVDATGSLPDHAGAEGLAAAIREIRA